VKLSHLALIGRLWSSPKLADLPGYCISLTIHLIVLLLLAGIAIRFAPAQQEGSSLEVLPGDGSDGTAEALDSIEMPLDSGDKRLDTAGGSGPLEAGPVDIEKVLPPLDTKAPPPAIAVGLASITGKAVGFGGELGGRTGNARKDLLARGGGTAGSERAVGLGLDWLARYQQSDGKWSFYHGSDDPGRLDQCTTGATGLALLAFLGAGHTHRSEASRYHSAVGKGIRFLLSQMKRGESGGDLRGTVVANEGMYAQAIATLALCEAYGLTHDVELKSSAQQAVNFIVSAQDPHRGGWRYAPRDAGDTTVTGWQLMALKSAKSSHLRVPETTLLKAGRFLDFVQTAHGSRYGYDRAGDEAPMTAIALLCRMYLGWTREHSALKKGVEYLSRKGPSPIDIYYDYYATQVLHHWAGPEWKKWNDVLRDHLVDTQVKTGKAAGSWTPTGDRGAEMGGRLYQTCLSVMTLEVYYRYLPLYQSEVHQK
jgi:hypothetical protein